MSSITTIILYRMMISLIYSFFFFNDTATTEIYTLSLHDALPICHQPRALISFCTLTEDLKKALPDNLTELVALTIATKRSEEHTSELQSLRHLVCRLLLEKKTSRRAAPAPLPPARD